MVSLRYNVTVGLHTCLLTPGRQLPGRSGTGSHGSMPPQLLPPLECPPASCERWCRRPADRRHVPRHPVSARSGDPPAARAALVHAPDLCASSLPQLVRFGFPIRLSLVGLLTTNEHKCSCVHKQLPRHVI